MAISAHGERGRADRLSVPEGVIKVRLAGNLEWQTSPASQLLEIRKNGTAVIGGGAMIVRGDGGYSNQMRHIASAVLAVTAGEWFKLAVYVGAAGEVRGLERTWFALEVVETEAAAEPLSDITLYKPSQPGAGEVLLRVPIARRTRFKADLAGSHGSAGSAPAAQADLDVRRNGVSFAAIRFTAGATSATFIAASETVLAPGDVLTITAPAPADPSLADVGVVLAGALVV